MARAAVCVSGAVVSVARAPYPPGTIVRPMLRRVERPRLMKPDVLLIRHDTRRNRVGPPDPLKLK